MTQQDLTHAWWSRLRHQGLLLSPVVMQERFADAPAPAPFYHTQRLRDAYTRFLARAGVADTGENLDQNDILTWTDAVLQDFVGHTGTRLARQHGIPGNLTAAVRIGSRTETLRPHRVVFADDGGTQPAILVMADTSPHVGRGRGRTVYARFLELLRGTGHRLGLLTNGHQVRLIYAGLDFESWCEWEADRWFADAEGAEELAGLRQLLAPTALAPTKDGTPGLLDAIEESRKRQADLSSVLRENVRQAVELLLEEVSAANRTNPALFAALSTPSAGRPLTDAEAHDALFQAAVRIVMRQVVCLFAESRRLLPVGLPVYDRSYGLRSLYELLEEAARHEGGTHGLLNRHMAWPRLTALFRLVHDGCAHPDLNMPAYGGVLFRPGHETSDDAVLRALAILEHNVGVSDATIHAVLRKLLRGPLPVVRGRSRTYVDGPVDYTNLRTEFIGLIYEGLLDYRLKRTDETFGPQVFLAIGREPVLPLLRLEDMLAHDRAGLKNLLATLKKEKVVAAATAEEEEEPDEAEEEAEEGEAPEEAAEIQVEAEPEAARADIRGADFLDAEGRARGWAREAVILTGMVGAKRRGEPESEYQARIDAEAARLIKKVVATGEFYLVRAGNTRKGTGTFYTRPQLAVPTVHRTLQPLCYEKGEAGALVPKKPDEILALKVCDSSCGSASFLVAALHYLSEALYRSLKHHCDIEDPEAAKRITLPLGKPRTGRAGEEIAPFPPDPENIEPFEARVKALLRRHVVERCIYGVDINPLAVEFARVSLWIETMDKGLPLTFLDHKVKVGNALVGCWLRNVLDYPMAAWEREGGDGKDGPRTALIETCLKGEKGPNGRRPGDGRIKKEMREVIDDRFSHTPPLFPRADTTAATVVEDARRAYEALHAMSVHEADEREAHFRTLEHNPAVLRLKRAMDEWCAVWFWPMDAESAKHAPTPKAFHAQAPEREAILARLAAEVRFFHWELEFPDVFTPQRAGFDAVVGNPPWEVMKPNSHEFFTEFDPIYRAYDKQRALAMQQELFAADPAVRERWIDYCGRFKALSNWAGGVQAPFDMALERGNRGTQLAADWKRERTKRVGYAGADHPYRHQGSADLNSYKMFLETAYHLLHDRGRLGMIVPSGLYTDSGTQPLRELFLERSTWEWLFSFENKRRIFEIHGAYKFAPVIVDRRRTGAPLLAAFMVHDLAAWDRPDPPVFEYDRGLISLFSPRSKSLPEVRTPRDLEICRKIYEHSFRIGDNAPGWEITYANEFHMTNDSKHFPPLEKWKAKGYKPDVFGRWIGPGGDVALPLYEGRMIGQFDFSKKGWVSGKGRSAVWRDLAYEAKAVEPQFMMAHETFAGWEKARTGFKVVGMSIVSSTNTRTTYTACNYDVPCNHALFVLKTSDDRCDRHLLLTTCMNSFAFDFATRQRVGGLNLSWFIIDECPLPKILSGSLVAKGLLLGAARLTFIHRRFAPEWLRLKTLYPELAHREWKHWWAVTEADRLRLRVEIDAFCADLYAVDPDDFDWVVRDDPSDPKGFWRIDKKQPYDKRLTGKAKAEFTALALPFGERLTGLAARAFRALKEGKWSADSAAGLSNDEFFEILGIPELTSPAAAKAKGLPEPLILKREGCHSWHPERFAPDDPRHGWTWADCWKDAVALLGSEQAVRDYVEGKKTEAAEPPEDGAKPGKGKKSFRLKSGRGRSGQAGLFE
jgi:hypothetical protein